MTANRAMAQRIVWGTRIDDDTPAADARELLEMCGLVEPGGREILPDQTHTGRLIDEQGRPVATAPVRSPAAPAPAKKRRGGPGRKPVPIEHGTDHGYRQHKQKRDPIPADDACGCQAAHDALLTRPARHAAISVPDPLTGAPLPTEPPTPAEAMAEQAALDVPVGEPPDPGSQPPTVPTSPTDLDEWLAVAQRSPRIAVRRHAQTAVLVLLQLRCALDDLARAERSPT